jgi:DNA-binding NarL/FixJ family response regulator
MNLGVTSPRQLVRKSLCALLTGLDGVSSVLEISSPLDSPELLRKAALDIVLVDAFEPTADLEVLSHLRSVLPGTALLVLIEEHEDQDYQCQAISRGARGFISRDCAPEVLEKALRAMAKGEMWITHRIATRVIGKLLQREPDGSPQQAALSPREHDILALLAEGYRNKEIASMLSVSDNTIRAHIASLYRKLQVSGRVEAALYYYGKGKKNGRPPLTSPADPDSSAITHIIGGSPSTAHAQ